MRLVLPAEHLQTLFHLEDARDGQVEGVPARIVILDKLKLIEFSQVTSLHAMCKLSAPLRRPPYVSDDVMQPPDCSDSPPD